eukprot:INCI16027.2.p3 GENE.INCI16027.2~~INCI16027.2.p3  ORF type:complete len:438 (+),score=75.08 INCI16027.2:192-1505(+)
MPSLMNVVAGGLVATAFVAPSSVLLVAAVDNVATLTVADLAVYPTARCLDGTGYGFYYREGAAEDTDKWMIMLEGGGLCTGEKDCTSRASTDLGSSSKYASTMDLGGIGYMTNDTANPFRNWHQIYVRYCDGSMWTGARQNATDPATFGLWITGHNNIAALIDHFSKGVVGADGNHYSMAAPNSTVILSGGSAGGIGAFNNVDFVAHQLPNSLVLGAPVGGFPPQLAWYTGPGASAPDEDGRDPSYTAHDAFWGSFKSSKCVDDMGANASSLCVVPYHLYDHLETPVFIVEAITDAVIMCGFEGLPCKPVDLLRPEVGAFIEDYAHNFSLSIQRLSRDTPRNGLFAASCLMHTGFELDKPLINGTNAVAATFEWYEYHAARFHSAAKLVGRTRPQRHNDADFVWVDHCSDEKYFPPCDAVCPATPDANAIAVHVGGF